MKTIDEIIKAALAEVANNHGVLITEVSVSHQLISKIGGSVTRIDGVRFSGEAVKRGSVE